MLTCKDAILLMCDFLDSTLGPPPRPPGSWRLTWPAASRAWRISTPYRKTQALTGAAAREEMPAEMKARLRNFLLEHLARLEI